MANVKYAPEEPICAVATALSPSALGIVRCTGKNCIELVSAVFSRPKALLSAAGNSIVYGWIQDGGVKIDEVMVSVFRSPKSFTGEDMAEISCHGGPGVVLAVQKVLLSHGFRQAEKGEYTFRAFINGKADLTRAEAVREIIDSHTGEGRSRAAGRLAGNLFDEIDGIKKLITDTLASIEVEIEYPEDEETISDTFDRRNLVDAIQRLQNLSDSWQGEKLYQDGARVVLCGKTNAGKSSLFNSILKEERAIVSDIEGTTRDWIESFVDFDGIPVRLFDTAGIRETQDLIEAQGVELTKNLSQDADVVLYLVDGTKGLLDEDKKFIEECGKPCVLVWNKCDLAQNLDCNTKTDGKLYADSKKAGGVKQNADCSAAPDVHARAPFNTAAECIKNVKSQIKISAKKGVGFDGLYSSVKTVLTEGMNVERTQIGLGSERQRTCVDEALQSLRHSLEAADEFTLDALVQDLEEALDFLGEVTGEVSADDVLESIFSNFCVGK